MPSTSFHVSPLHIRFATCYHHRHCSVYVDNSEKGPCRTGAPSLADTEGTRCCLAESLRFPNRPLHAGQGGQIKPRARHRPVELLHSAPKCCHYGKRRTTWPSPRGPCGNPGLTYQTLPGIPLLPEAWAGALCIEISGHRMVSDAEQWPGLVARSQESVLVPKPSEGEGGNSAQGAPGGRAGGQGPFLR